MINKIKLFFMSFFSIMWVSAIAAVLFGPGDVGGADVNGFLVILLWILFVYIVIKKHPLIACVACTVLYFVIRIRKYGIDDTSGATGQLIIYGILFFGVCKFLFGSTRSDMGNRVEVQKQRSRQNKVNEDLRYDQVENDSFYYERDREEYGGPKLVSGSDEYWEYKEAAEAIYRDFCDSNSITQRRYHKQRGEKLKIKLLSEYGAKDECVRTIIDNFLDLRV